MILTGVAGEAVLVLAPCPGILADLCSIANLSLGEIMRKAFALVLLSCCMAGAQNLTPAVKPFVKVDSPVIALLHVRVIDGTGAAAREDQTVILSKGKIESVGDASAANLPKDAQVLDLKGYSVIPGLVGMHEHMFFRLEERFFTRCRSAFPDSTWPVESPRFAPRAALNRIWIWR